MYDLGCLNETVLDKVFLSRFHSVILRMQFFFSEQSFYTRSFKHYIIEFIYSLVFWGELRDKCKDINANSKAVLTDYAMLK